MRNRIMYQQRLMKEKQLEMKRHINDLEASAAQARAKLALQTRDDNLAYQDEMRRRQEADQTRQEVEDRQQQE